MSPLDSVRSAIEADLLRADGEVAGIGIDFEPWREAADLRTARFFLRPSEQAHVTDSRSLLRLWTVKEALFKATPDNGGAVLVDYALAEPESRSGSATGPRGEPMRYVSVEVENGLMTVAVCLTERAGNGAL